MSIQAMSWALNKAPITASQLGVLMALADKADDLGRGSWPSRETIAYQTRKTVKQVSRDLNSLKQAGVIKRGDQRRTAYLPRDRRPVVYDLCMERERDDDAPYREHPSGSTSQPVDNSTNRGDVDAPSVQNRGDIQGQPGGHTGSTGGTYMSPNPSLTLPEPSIRNEGTNVDRQPVDNSGWDGWMGNNSETDETRRKTAESVLEDIFTSHRVKPSKRPKQRLRDALAGSVRQLLTDGATAKEIIGYVASRGELGAAEIRVPGEVLKTRLADYLQIHASMPATAKQTTAVQACERGPACADGQLLCGLECSVYCPGGHEARGSACPSCNPGMKGSRKPQTNLQQQLTQQFSPRRTNAKRDEEKTRAEMQAGLEAMFSIDS